MVDEFSAEHALDPPLTWADMLKRGLRKKCPRCGGGHLYRGWYRMKERCPTCGFKFEREPGFFVSAAFINFAFTEGLLFILVMVMVLILSQNDNAGIAVPIAIGAAAALIGPIVFYPFSRTIWSAIDLSMSPLELEEIVEAQDFVNEQAANAGATPPPAGTSAPDDSENTRG